MIIEVSKSTSEKKIKSLLKKRNKKDVKSVSAFFGKLPNIEDGLTFQKKVRSEWK